MIVFKQTRKAVTKTSEAAVFLSGFYFGGMDALGKGGVESVAGGWESMKGRGDLRSGGEEG